MGNIRVVTRILYVLGEFYTLRPKMIAIDRKVLYILMCTPSLKLRAATGDGSAAWVEPFVLNPAKLATQPGDHLNLSNQP